MHSSMIPDDQSVRIAPLECPPGILLKLCTPAHISHGYPKQLETTRNLLEIENLVMSRFLLLVG
jgi:hypothetical protein